ncbi:MAG: LCP family protein [Nitriliruptoraceae bacterium]|nr:LCP family protein [Nitriliruptoraceae bacterium]
MARGRPFRTISRVTASLLVLSAAAALALNTTAQLLVEQAERNLTRVPVPELEQPLVASDARHFLVVGSDARDGLGEDERRELRLGDFDGQRSDVIMYVSISEDRETISLVSLPRDLLVVDQGRNRKLTDTFAGGPDQLVRVVRDNFGLPVNHYASVSLGGFIEVVRTLGTVEICLDDPLVDPLSGADFTAGCHDMDAADALAFVRSRQGPYADFERIGRQQTFLTAVLRELTDARILVNPPRLFQLVEDVATNLTTDDGLQTRTMLGLADEMRQVVGGGVPMGTVPAYPRRIDGIEYMIAYPPGAQRMFDDLREGRPLADPGLREDRDEVVVAIYSGGRGSGTEIVRSTLAFAGFQAGFAGSGPELLDAGAVTAVYEVEGFEQEAGWVAATLGADVQPLPADVEPPAGTQVVVSVGDDAAP